MALAYRLSDDNELTGVLLNPSTLTKARAGGVLTRLLTRTALELVGAQMFAPSPERARELADLLSRDSLGGDSDPRLSMLVHNYVIKNFSPAASGLRQRCLFLLFRGENAIEHIKDAVGDYETPSIRRTYGDMVRDEHGKVIYFEPAVFCPSNQRSAVRLLDLFARAADHESSPLENVVSSSDINEPGYQRSLVIIKPDNFDYPCGRPGSIMNIFSRADLRITAAKVARLSVAQMEEFYEAVLPAMIEGMGEEAGRARFNALIGFMTGRHPAKDCPAGEDRHAPGTVQVLILIYEGVDAIRKIRDVLGPTDPATAPPGTIRREFGASKMINGAHASDSPASAEREMRILKIGENQFPELIRQAIGQPAAV